MLKKIKNRATQMNNVITLLNNALLVKSLGLEITNYKL